MTTIPPEYINQIVTGDARELAKRIPDKCAALAFADPPYWVGYDYGNKTDRDMDYIDPIWLATELQRVGNVAMLTPGIGNIYDYPKPFWVMAWLKLNAQQRNASGGANAWEPVFVYGKTRIDNDTVKAVVGYEYDADFHSCPKPLKLMLWIIEKFTKPDDVIIDFTCGSGTTCKAAKMLGRNFIAFEIDPDTAERARERVRNTQPPLFVMPPTQDRMEFVES